MNNGTATLIVSEMWLRRMKTVDEIVTHFANQYYVYGPIRSGFSSYADDLRTAMTDDLRHGRKYYQTMGVIDSIYDICSEESAYVVNESKELICDIIHTLHDNARKENFKRKLANKELVTKW